MSNGFSDLAITIRYSGFSASAGHAVTLGIFRIHPKANDTFKEGKNKQPNRHLTAEHLIRFVPTHSHVIVR